MTMSRSRLLGNSRRGPVLAVLFIVATPAFLAAREKTDVVIMKNGDHITCEIKSLENGVLYLNPSYVLASYGVDWNEVERVESKQSFTVTLTNGARVSGTIEKVAAKEEGAADFKIVSASGPVAVKSDDISLVQQVEKGFWNQQTGAVNAGVSYTQGNNSAQFSVAGNTDYRKEKYTFHLDGSAVLSSQAKTATARYTLNSTYNRFISGPWYTGTILNLLRSDQQELRLRASLGQGLGRDLLRTNRTYLTAIAGGVFTTEFYNPEVGVKPHTREVEGVLGTTFSLYRFSNTQILNQTYFYPNFSTWGRVRVSTNTSLMFEIARNLKWYFTVYENFDSEPPINAPRNDFGVTTSLGWTF